MTTAAPATVAWVAAAAVLLTTVALWLGVAAPLLHVWPFGGCLPGTYARTHEALSGTALTPPSHCLRDADCRQGGGTGTCVDGACLCASAARDRRARDSPCPVGGEDGATPCSGNGVCDADEGTCTCAPTHTGPDCAVAVPAPDPATVGGKDPVSAGDQVRQCSGHGHVVQDGDTSSCLCDDGWTGDVCDAYEDPSKASRPRPKNRPAVALPAALGGVGALACGDHGTPTLAASGDAWSCACDAAAGGQSWSGDHCEVPPAGNVYPRTDQSDRAFLCGNYGSYASDRYDPVTASCRPDAQQQQPQVPCPNGFFGDRCEIPCRSDADCGQGPAVAYAADGNGRWTDAAAVRPGTMHAVPMGVCNLPGRGPGLHDADLPDQVCVPRVPAPGSYGRCRADHATSCHADADCGSAGPCDLLGTCGSAPQGRPCFDATDCGSDGSVACTVPPPGPCLARRCRAATATACVVDADCPAGDSCDWTSKAVQRNSDGACPAGSVAASTGVPSDRSGVQLQRRPGGGATCASDADCGSARSCASDLECMQTDGPGTVCAGCPQDGVAGTCAYRRVGMLPDARFCSHAVVAAELAAGNAQLRDVACCPTHPDRKAADLKTPCGTGTCYASDGSVVEKLLGGDVTGRCDHDPDRPCRSATDCLETVQTLCFRDRDCRPGASDDVPGLPNMCARPCLQLLHDAAGALLPADKQHPVATFGVCMATTTTATTKASDVPSLPCAHDQQCGPDARCVAPCDPTTDGVACMPVRAADADGAVRLGACQSVAANGSRAGVCGADKTCACPGARVGPFCDVYIPPGTGCHGGGDCPSGVCVAVAPGYGMCFTGTLTDDTREMYTKLRAGLEAAAMLGGLMVGEKYVLRGLVAGFGRALVESFEKAGFESTAAALRFAGAGGLREVVAGGVRRTLGSIVRGFSYARNLGSAVVDTAFAETTERASAQAMEGFVERVAARALARTMTQEAAEAAVDAAMDALLAAVSGPVGVVFAVLDVMQIVGMILDLVDPMHVQNELRQTAIDKWVEGMHRAYNAQLAVVGAEAMPAPPPTAHARKRPEFLREIHSAAGQHRMKKYLVEYVEGITVNSEGQVVLRCGQPPAAAAMPPGLLVPRTGVDALLWRLAGQDPRSFRRLRGGGGVALLAGGVLGTVALLALVATLVVMRVRR